MLVPGALPVVLSVRVYDSDPPGASRIVTLVGSKVAGFTASEKERVRVAAPSRSKVKSSRRGSSVSRTKLLTIKDGFSLCSAFLFPAGSSMAP